MLISPRTAVKEGWVKFPDWMSEEQREKCFQPNALDFTIDHLKVINATDCMIAEDKKEMRTSTEIGSVDGFWSINPGAYDFMSDFYVSLPEGVAAEVIARSTFVRNGMFITTGLWDSGFQGPAGGVIHNVIALSKIQQHVRVGQLKFVKTDKGGVYAGGYNTDAGIHWQTTTTTTRKVK